MSRVFVVQRTRKYNRETQELEDKFPLKPLYRWGEVVEVLTPTAKPFNAKNIIREMRTVFEDFNDDDFILPVGNTSLIGMAITVAQEANNGRCKLLQWSPTNKCHVQIIVDFNQDEEL